MSTIEAKCKNKECNKLVTLWWELIGSMRVIRNIDGVDYYTAKCPECGCTWHVNCFNTY